MVKPKPHASGMKSCNFFVKSRFCGEKCGSLYIPLQDCGVLVICR